MLVSLQRIVLQKYETYQTDAMDVDMAGKQLIVTIWFWLHIDGKMEPTHLEKKSKEVVQLMKFKSAIMGKMIRWETGSVTDGEFNTCRTIGLDGSSL